MKYTIKQFIKFLRFYQMQGLTVNEIVELLEYYGDNELSTFVSDQPEPVPSA